MSVPAILDESEIISGVRDALCVLADLLEFQNCEEQCGMVVMLAEDLRRAMDLINADRDRETAWTSEYHRTRGCMPPRPSDAEQAAPTPTAEDVLAMLASVRDAIGPGLAELVRRVEALERRT